MENFGEPIDIFKLSSDLMSLSSGEIEELATTLRKHWMGGFKKTLLDPDKLASLAIIESINETDKEKADVKLQIAEWFKKYSELEEQHKQDEAWMESINDENKFYKEFWDYMSEEAIGDKSSIIETITNNSHNWSEGYVKVEKSINDKQEILLKFITKSGDKYTATWQPCDNYACWQTNPYEDYYSGYLLFPTYNDHRYFCVAYDC